MSQTSYLIVEQQQKPAEDLPELLKRLSQNHGLDIYQSRQRLIGKGLSLLGKGSREQLEKVSPLLQDYKYKHWLLEPSKPKFVPHRIRGLQIDTENVIFNCVKKQVTFPKGASVLAVFAEMSGKLAEKSVTQLLSSHAYRGRDNVRHLEEHKIRKTILQGKPQLDLYLLDDKKQIVDAVRIFPGKFDSKGLGERATLSSVQNLERILQLAKDYAGDFELFTDFGLVNLPGCTLRRENPEDPETIRQNQISLARYGWLMADLHRVGPTSARADKDDDQDQLTGAVAAALLMQNPALAASGQAEQILPAAKEIAREVNAAADDQKTESPSPQIAEEGLPAPPEIRRTNGWNTPAFWYTAVSGVLGIPILLFLESGGNGAVGKFSYHAFASGGLFFVLSALLLWSGFSFIQLKRQVENTPTSKVRSIAMGMVEVKGRAIRQYALISPMSQIPCVYYRMVKYRKSNNKWQVSSASSSDNVPFLIEDDTGKVEVDPNGCRISAGTKQEGLPGQVGLTRLTDDPDEKWVEEVVVEGTLLYVLGFASVKKSQGPTMAERKAEALRELKRNPQDIKQFDTDGDGRLSTDEWDRAREAVSEKVLRDELRKKQQRRKQEEHVVIGKKKGRPLVIAETHSEQHLTGRYNYYSIALLIGAVVLLGWGINNLLSYLI